MIDNKTFLAIIPARGGSKRLPNKNVKKLCGIPLISWSIKAAKSCHYLDKIIVSSENENILNIARKYGSEYSKRPEELATDEASTYSVVKHVIDNVAKFDYIVLLQPTSPLRFGSHISEAIELLNSKKADAVVSVCMVDHSPFHSNIIPNNGSLSNFLSDNVKGKRTQELDDFFRINGAIYICKTTSFLKNKSFFIKENIFAYYMNRQDSVDIDEEIDFLFAEFLLKQMI